MWHKIDISKAVTGTQVRIEHDLPLPMILMGEPLANYVKSLDCRCELASEARTKTGNELLLLIINLREKVSKIFSTWNLGGLQIVSGPIFSESPYKNRQFSSAIFRSRTYFDQNIRFLVQGMSE
jgi:hypothetical protein